MNGFLKILMPAALAIVPAASFGQTVVEQFNYPAGSITGQNGGTGFTGAYTGVGNVTSPGLTYSGLQTDGNKFTTAGGDQGAFRTINAIGTDAGTLFVGFLASVTGTAEAPLVPGYGGVSFFTGGSEELFLGKPSSTTTYGFDVSGVDGDGTVGTGRTTSEATITPSLLVYRLNFTDAGDTIDVFVNPTPGQALPATPNGTFAIPEDAFPGSFDNIRLQSGGQVINFDEIRVGTTFAQVAPAVAVVPEPAAAGLIGCGLALLAGRRRRRQH